MKTQVPAFGFEVLVTYLLPGILATGKFRVLHLISRYDMDIFSRQ